MIQPLRSPTTPCSVIRRHSRRHPDDLLDEIFAPSSTMLPSPFPILPRQSSSLLLLLFLLILCILPGSLTASDDSTNKYRQREASDDQLPYPVLDETALTNSQCPQHVELRWQTEVSSSIYATPLLADINSDGRLEVVIPSFVHNIDVLDGSDGEKLAGWPVTHQSTVHSSPLLYDIDKDGLREIAIATYHGEILFFRPSGYLMTEKLVLPRERIRKNWYVGLKKDHADRSHPDIDDKGLITENLEESSSSDQSKSATHVEKEDSKSVDANINNITSIQSERSIRSNEVGGLAANDTTKKTETLKPDFANMEGDDVMKKDVLGHDFDMMAASANRSLDMGASSEHGGKQTRRRILENQEGLQSTNDKPPSVENDQGVLEDAADASFDVFRDEEENMEDGLTEEYQYDYDDYVDESMWGDENWREAQHEKEEDYVNVDAHILCTPVIADIDKDGIDEMVIATSFFFDREYYDKPEASRELGGIDISKYVAGAILVFNLDTKQLKWRKLLDLSTDDGQFRAYIYSSPTLVDLDNDGYMDILVGTSFGYFYVLDHRGESREEFPKQMGEIQAQIVAADINDDGKIEIVTTDTRGNVAAWTKEGTELWEVHLKSLIAQGPTVGDVDGDGHTEIVIPTASGNIYALKGSNGQIARSFPFRTHGRVMAPVLLLDLNKPNSERRALTLIVSSFDGYLYLIDGSSACADVIDVGETSYSMVLADNVDGGDDLDLIVTTMNGNVFCFSTPALYDPAKSWSSQNQGRNVLSSRSQREAIYISTSSRNYRDEGGEGFWVQFNIIDELQLSHGPYNVTVTLLVPHNYMGQKRITESRLIDQPGKHQFRLPCVSVRSSGTVVLEMIDKNGLYFSDEFSLTFHMHYYRLLKWMVVLPMLGMFCILLWLHPETGAALPSFSRDR